MKNEKDILSICRYLIEEDNEEVSYTEFSLDMT